MKEEEPLNMLYQVYIYELPVVYMCLRERIHEKLTFLFGQTEKLGKFFVSL